jgi:tight adherence protein B
MMDNSTLIILFAAVLAGGFALFLLNSLAGAADSKRHRNRLARARGQATGPSDGSGEAAVKLTKDLSASPFLEAMAARFLPRPALLRERLEKTGWKISLGHYFAVCVATGLGATLLRMLILDLPVILAVLYGIAAGLGLPHLAIKVLIARRYKAFLAQFPEAMDLITRGLKSGLPVTESMRQVGTEFTGPVGEEFRFVSDRIKLGQPLEEALWDVSKRIDLPEYKFFVISLAVQRETGGNLSETLDNLSDILRKRRQLKLKIKALSSEAKASAIIIGSLPFVMLGLLMLVNEDYMMQLFTDPRGNILLGIGAFFLAFGTAVMVKMVRFEY